MNEITIEAQITADRQLTDYHLPPNVPIGRVRLVIQPIEGEAATRQPLTREEARAKLLAAGKLSTARYAPEGAVHSTEEESKRLAQLFSHPTQTLLDLVDEDRGPRE